MPRSHQQLDALVVGAGFAGMYMLYRLNRLGLATRVIEKASGVGGTWFWNRYPGARCDIESMQYSYSFSHQLEQEWEWSERYASQKEILEYANHVADRFDLRKDMQFDTEVTSAHYSHCDEDRGSWTVSMENKQGCTSTIRARFLVMATGCLSAPNTAAFSGIEDFAGPCYHTGSWPHQEIDFTGKRVAIIGTGSSGIQATTAIARQASQLFVFQRTANYIVPANNQPFRPGEQQQIKDAYGDLRSLARKARNGVAQEIVTDPASAFTPSQREQRYQQRWDDGGLTFIGVFSDLLLDAESNQTAADFIRERIHEVVHDPETAKMLCPDSTFGCKRLCVDSDYYDTFNRDSVTLVNIKEHGIEKICSRGPVVNGKVYDVDALVLATGFDAMTGTLKQIDIRGRDGLKLVDKWIDGPTTCLGLMVAGFPNLFTITGPGSPSVLSNMLGSIEFHVDWISGCIEHLEKREANRIEATESAESLWGKEVERVVDQTVYRTCESW